MISSSHLPMESGNSTVQPELSFPSHTTNPGLLKAEISHSVFCEGKKKKLRGRKDGKKEENKKNQAVGVLNSIILGLNNCN